MKQPMRQSSWLALIAALVFSLAFGQAEQQEEAQQQQQQVQQQPVDPWAADPRWAAPGWVGPAWTDPIWFEREVAMVRLAQLSPNAPSLDIRLSWLEAVVPEEEEQEQEEEGVVEAFEEARAELSGLEYLDITDYVLVPAGPHTITITEEGEELAVLYQVELDLTAGAYYTLATVGFVLGTDEEIDAAVMAEQEAEEEGFFSWLEDLFTDRDREDLTFRIEVYDDVPSAFPIAGHANVRVINAAIDTPNIDLVARRVDIEEMPTAVAPVAPPADPAAPPAAEPVVPEPVDPEEEPEEEPAEPEEPEEPEEEPEDAETASLEITVEPEDATVVVVGPDGYEQEFSGSQTLTDLTPGTYIITATSEGYAPAEEEVEVEEGETATVEITLEEAEEVNAEPEAEEEPEEPAEEPEAEDPAAAPADPAAPPAAAPAVAPVDPAVDPWLMDFVLVGDLAFPFASDYEEIQAFHYELTVRLAGQEIIVHEIEAAELRPGTIYTIFVTGTTMEDYPMESIVLADVWLVSSPLEELEEVIDEEEPEEEPEEEEPEEDEEEEDAEEEEEDETNNGG